MTRLLRGAALAALSLAAVSVAGAASAQSYSRLVVFGDSLSDNGNLYLATGGSTPASPPYGAGRFSNGPVFTERLGFNAANFMGPVTGSINYAFGGARTDSQAQPLGMRLQLAQYLQRGGTFGANDLVSVLGGANNIFQGLPAAGASTNPTGAITPVALGAASDMNFIVNSIAQAGAGTVLVTNLPKLSLTPQFRATPAAPLADFAVTTFNGALLTGLNATAAARPGTNIILMDLFKVGDVISGNPSAFGVSNVTQACFNGVTVCSNPDSYFYFDGVHPTAKGHELIARLANDYLYYGDLGSQTAVLGETAWRHREDALDGSTAALSGREAWMGGTSISVGALADKTETDARGAIGKATSDGYGVRIALESGSETWRFGLSGSYRNADVDAGALRADIDSFGLDVYGGWRAGDLFVNAAAGVAQDDFNDINRLTSLAPIVHSGSTRGVSTGARLQGGMWFDMGGFALSPRAAVAWINADVDGFSEQGPAAQYAYADRSVQATTAEIALRAEGGTERVRFYAEGGYRDSLSDDSDAVRTGILGNPAKVLARDVDLPFGGQVLAAAGIEGTVMERLKVSIGYKGRFGDHADSHMAAVKFSLPL
ncbi:autotransporter domain-containing esterase [Brevundimonas naejangsanensis]|uniref:Autotransporter outer membrane beta-barrel domain-containing protein n=1 Tax=Brevundimonas naejangsanensis TaxID=588932 RepID=A0A172Y6K1_9CAUL|nr:autotransporter domain-containing esterase [Brevundimonas naejangsanensis]ANF54772.1 autotransporter outer membrane beta-barrel domain-containing protein [Brevundimonas naejangsanensis]QBQ47507.1 autotransporter domain-containing esterase [Brevundimonas naejangsanensis]